MPFVITGRSLSARCLPLETISFFPPWWHTSLVAASPPSQWYRTLAAVLPLLQWCPPLALAASCHLFGDDLPDPGSSLATSLVMPSPVLLLLSLLEVKWLVETVARERRHKIWWVVAFFTWLGSHLLLLSDALCHNWQKSQCTMPATGNHLFFSSLVTHFPGCSLTSFSVIPDPGSSLATSSVMPSPGPGSILPPLWWWPPWPWQQSCHLLGNALPWPWQQSCHLFGDALPWPWQQSYHLFSDALPCSHLATCYKAV